MLTRAPKQNHKCPKKSMACSYHNGMQKNKNVLMNEENIWNKNFSKLFRWNHCALSLRTRERLSSYFYKNTKNEKNTKLMARNPVLAISCKDISSHLSIILTRTTAGRTQGIHFLKEILYRPDNKSKI